MACLVLMLVASFVYYRQTATILLPTLQKLVFVSSTDWPLWLHRDEATGKASSSAAG
jgi:hypothetical protein